MSHKNPATDQNGSYPMDEYPPLGLAEFDMTPEAWHECMDVYIGDALDRED